MTHPYWPVLDLRLTIGDVELRPLTEADQVPLADLLPDDVELDPAAVRFTTGDERRSRGTTVLQSYWRAYGTWRPEAWRLGFGVRRDGELVGVQELEAHDFAVLRTVDSASFLVASARGQGIGRRMRTAVLALAFSPLEAAAAITEAWHDNHASLGVSRALGYRPNGESFHQRGETSDVMVHLRLLRADWLAAGHGDDVVIEGVDGCAPWFGA